MNKSKKKGIYHKANKFFGSQRKGIAYFFFGVGITMFLLNVNAIVQILPYVELFERYFNVNPLMHHFVSIASAIILIFYALSEITFEG
ncbi:MAG: hypothetical protein ACOCXG_02890 [Nanoarchaeota archaeon]